MKNKIISALTALSIFFGAVPVTLSYSSADVAYPFIADSGISYKESVRTINNPSAGYTTTVWPVCSPGKTPVYSPTGNLVLFFIDIGGFSSGANGTASDDGTYTAGTDYDLDETFFNSFRTTFENCRKNGCMIALRFRYDANGKENPEPDSFEQVLRHIQQIKDNGILEDYKDILCFVESGFVGKWGEQHGGKYVTVDYKARVLDAMLDCVPAPIPVTVRTPDIFAKFVGIKRSELGSYVAKNDREARVGLYDDGYMGSDSDLGTYSDREKETSWLGRQAVTSYFGGEFSGDLKYAQQFDTYLPKNAIPEMYKTRLSYINSNIFQLYKNYEFNEECDVEGVDNSAYYGQNVFQFIRDHIGYRFVLRGSELPMNVFQGEDLDLHFFVENTGFANPIPKQTVQFIIEKDGNYLRFNSNIDSNKWYSCTTAEENIKMLIPGSLPTGKWNLYMKITEGNNSLDQLSMRSVQLANDDIWNPTLGANYMGSFNVDEADVHSGYNSFRQSDYLDAENDSLRAVGGYTFTIRDDITADGIISSPYEWPEKSLIAEADGNSLYMSADEDNLYVMGQLPDTAEAPVYNLRLTRADGESYWIYFQSNGFVYFNHGDHTGAKCKWSGKTVEFMIPLSLMGLEKGTQLSLVRLFQQDSANEWKVVGDIRKENTEIIPKFRVYTACSQIRVYEGEKYTMKAETALKNVSYQWFKNDVKITGANSETYTTPELFSDDTGVYSVEITSSDGITRTVDICNIIEVLSSNKVLYGDANCSGEVKMNDAVLIMQAIANQDAYGVDGTEASHITPDGQMNADCYIPGSGITNMDAYYIQCFLIGTVKSLPVYD